MTSTQPVIFRVTPPSPIRDTVHNYIRTTKLETHTLDTPEFQRLRDILQNSTAYLTFPSNTNTRFAHSLGVMHLAGKMLVTTLKNSDPEILRDFLDDITDLICHYANINKRNPEPKKIQVYETQWKELLGNISRFSHNPELFASIDLNREYEGVLDPYFLINTIWQVVRLGALTHDFGHLPMSHVFESAIESTLYSLRDRDEKQAPPSIFEECMNAKWSHFEQTGDRNYPEFKGHIFKDVYSKEYTETIERKLHETLGLDIFCSMYDGTRHDEYAELIKNITIRVLASPPHSIFSERNEEPGGETKRLSLLSFLHSIFDNDFIDADRIDYCLRDPLSSGSELGAFDSERVISSCTLVKHDSTYRLAHNYKSIGAIESFFFQRHLIYTGIIYHHSILRMNALIKHIIKELILYFDRHHDNNADPIIATALQFNLFSILPGSTYEFLSDRNISTYDESWLKTMFRAVQKSCKQIPEQGSSAREAKLLHMLIGTYLERKVENLVSVWKSPKDCQDRLDFDIETFQELNLLISANQSYYEYESLIKDLELHFSTLGIVFLTEKIHLPKFAQNPVFIRRDGAIDNVDSIALRSLSEMSKSLLTINFFLVGESLKGSTDLPSYIEVIVRKFSAYAASIILKSKGI